MCVRNKKRKTTQEKENERAGGRAESLCVRVRIRYFHEFIMFQQMYACMHVTMYICMYCTCLYMCVDYTRGLCCVSVYMNMYVYT